MLWLTVPIFPIAELTLSQFPALLRFHAERRNRTRFEPLQADFLACFIAESIGSVVKTGEGRVDFSQKFSLTVTRPEFETKLGFLRGAIIRIGEIGRLILHVVDGAIHFVHEFAFPRGQYVLEMAELLRAHVCFTASSRIR